MHKKSFISLYFSARHIDPECCFSLEALPARKSHKFNRLYEAIEYGRTAYQTETTDDSVKDTRSKFLELVLDLEPKFKAYQELMHKHGETGLSEQMRSKNSKRRRKRRTKWYEAELQESITLLN